MLEWANSLDQNLRAIDREADLLSNLILGSNFPMFPIATVFKANAYVQNAIRTYLGKNSLDGCLDRFSVNYNPQANFDSGKMCLEQVKFGGVFSTTSTAGGCVLNNILTNAQSCPAGYLPKTSVLNGPAATFSLTECVGDATIQKGKQI